MGNIVIALTFVIILNVLMWFSQLAILDLNPAGSIYYHCEGTMLSSYGDCSNYTIISTPEGQLPIAASSVSPTSTNVFTDIFNTLLGWIKSIPGVNYLYAMVAAPYSLLKAAGIPNAIAFGMGVFWYVITSLILVAFLTGRE